MPCIPIPTDQVIVFATIWQAALAALACSCHKQHDRCSSSCYGGPRDMLVCHDTRTAGRPWY